jgi:hypothetical protein
MIGSPIFGEGPRKAVVKGLEVSAKRPISTLRGRGMFLRYAVATGSRLNPYPRHQA